MIKRKVTYSQINKEERSQLLVEILSKTHLSIEEVAVLINVAKSSIVRWQNGQQVPHYSYILSLVYKLTRLFPDDSYFSEKLEEVANI